MAGSFSHTWAGAIDCVHTHVRAYIQTVLTYTHHSTYILYAYILYDVVRVTVGGVVSHSMAQDGRKLTLYERFVSGRVSKEAGMQECGLLWSSHGTVCMPVCMPYMRVSPRPVHT